METQALQGIFGHDPYATLVAEIRDFAIFLIDAGGRVASWNEGARLLFGYEGEEIIGQPGDILFTAQDRAAGLPQQEMSRAAADGQAEDVRWHQRKDGGLFWANGVMTALRDEAGALRGFAKVARDDTASKQTEDALRESAENLRSTIELSPHVPWTATAEGAIEAFNERWLEMIGLSREAALGDGWVQLQHLEDTPGMKVAWMHAVTTGEPYDFEHRVRMADGEFRWMRSRALPGRDVSGRITRWYGTTEDIHERRQAEQERERLIKSLEFERARLAHIFARVPAFVALLSGSELVFELTNPAYQQIIGHRDVLGKPFRHALPEIEGQGYFELLDQVLETGQPFVGRELSVMLQREPGAPPEEVWVDFLYEPLLGAGGEPEGIFIHGLDITEQVKARQGIEFERELLADIFERSPAFVAVLRGRDLVYELFNPAYQQLAGHRDFIGRRIRDMLPEVEGQGYFELMDGVLATGTPYEGREMPVMLQREPGSTPEQRFVDVLFQPLFEPNGQVSGVFVHGVDITDQVCARREAESARQAAEEANRIKDEFLATLSHELRTPLSAILGWARMLRAGGIDEQMTATALATIERNAQAQAQLIEDILDVSRVITGKLRLDVQPVDLASIIEDAVDTVLPAAQAKGVRVLRVLDPGASMVSGDPARLQQVVWNLLSNAMKFTPRGGRVQVRLQRINSHVEIVVVDNGAGIAPDVLPHIFERFRQADSTSTRSHGGLGLGLAIVKHLAELHGGSVEVESAGLGLGAAFTVKLPLVAVRPPEASGQERVHPSSSRGEPFDRAPQLAGLHVLIVDDEDDTRLLLRTVLEQCGARVTSASSAPEALAALQRERPDVLVSDLGMPEEDGYSLIKKVRALPSEQGGATPAAALTAYARVEDRTRVLRSGFQLHVPKPVEPIELVTVVANLAGRMSHA